MPYIRLISLDSYGNYLSAKQNKICHVNRETNRFRLMNDNEICETEIAYAKEEILFVKCTGLCPFR